jgi:DNA invertase Pin-like site-specific DNA recombinase
MKKAVVYYRVSKPTKRDNMDTQKDRMAPWLEDLKEQKGYEIPEDLIFEEERSGEEIEKRPKFMKVMDLLGKGEAQVLIVYMSDRIGRFKERTERNQVMELILDKKILVETLYHGTFDPENEDQMDELEKLLTEARRENRWRTIRIRDGLKDAAKENRTGGKPPYGVIWNKETRQYEVDPDELRALKKIVSEYKHHGGLRVRDILNSDLQKYPLRSRKYKPELRAAQWRDSTIHGFMQNDFYFTGKIQKVNGGTIDTKLDPFFSKEEIFRVRHEMSRRDKVGGKGKPVSTNGRYLIYKLAQCGECGSILGVQEQHQNGKIYRYYRCRTAEKREGCSFRSYNANLLDLIVWQQFAANTSDPKALEDAILKEELLPNEEREKAKELLKASTKKIEKLEKEKKRLKLLFIKGRIDEELHDKEDDRIETELNKAKGISRKAQNTLNHPTEMKKAIQEASKAVSKMIKSYSSMVPLRPSLLNHPELAHEIKSWALREMNIDSKAWQKIFEMQKAILNRFVASTGKKIIIHQKQREIPKGDRPKPVIERIEIPGIIIPSPNHM